MNNANMGAGAGAPAQTVASQTGAAKRGATPSDTHFALVLIELGAVFLLVTRLGFSAGWASLWPLFIIVPGALLLALAFSRTGHARGSAVTGASFLLLLGLFFLATTQGMFSANEQAMLWPIYLLISGVALLTSRLAAKA